jgi:uncharacterized protein involved in outer membrane biogenesis
MRKWVLAALALLVLAVGVLALAAANLNSALNANRDWIAKQVEAALGRSVTFDAVELSLRGGLGARVSDLRIGDDPAYSREDFLRAREVRVSVRILPALRGRFEVSRVVVASPGVALIRTQRGLNAASLGAGKSGGGAHGAEETSGGGGSGLLLALVELEDGELRYLDRTTRPPRELLVSGLDLTASDVAAGAPIAFRLEATLTPGEGFGVPAGAPLPLAVEGVYRGEEVAIERAELGLAEGALRASGTLGLSQRQPLELRVRAEGVQLGGWDGSPVELEAKGALAAAGGPELVAQLRATQGKLRGFDASDLTGELRTQGGRATLERLTVKTLGGEIAASGSYDARDAARPAFDLHPTLKDVRVESLLGVLAPAAAKALQGRLAGELALRGAGSDWAAIRPSLTGNGRVRLEQAQLADVNLAEGVLDGITGVAGLSGLVSKRVRESHPSLFGTGKTEFDTLDAKLEIADGRLLAHDLRLAARDFAVAGGGAISLDGEVDFTGTFSASEALSGHLVEEVKQLRFLVGSGGRIDIPFRLVGEVAALRVVPDANALARAMLGQGLAEGLRKLAPGPAQPPAEGAPDPSPPSTKELLRQGRDLLLGR